MVERQISEKDVHILRRTFAIAMKSREHGNTPFGSVLADNDGTILLEAENSTRTDRDCTAHSEIILIRDAWRQFQPDYLADRSIYTSAEPCAMCAGAMVWANIRRVVYELGNAALYENMGQRADGLGNITPCRDVFAGAPWALEVNGPLLEREAVKAHEGFWE